MSVALLGVILASLSLGWQATTYVLTGGRIKVTLKVGAIGNGVMVTHSPAGLTDDWWQSVAEQGYRRPIVAVTVANVGRQPVRVDKWGLASGLGTSLYPMGDASMGPRLPFRLDVGEAETWSVDFAVVDNFIKATREALGLPPSVPQAPPEKLVDRVNAQVKPRPSDVVGIAELADGRSKRSDERLL